MPKSKSRRKKSPKRVLAIPDLEHAKMAVLNSLTSRVGRWHVAQGAVGCRPRGGGARRHRQVGASRPAAHMRPTVSPGELDQIQFLLGHVSIQTTERYLGCKQKLRSAVNDRLGIEPDAD